MRYLNVHLTKHVYNLYAENYIKPMEETKDLNKRKDVHGLKDPM